MKTSLAGLAMSVLEPSSLCWLGVLFSMGNCVACHSGPKWTLSTVFYAPGDVPNDAFGGVTPMSLDESTTPQVIPTTGVNGGTLCTD